MNHNIFWLLITISVLLEVIGDTFCKLGMNLSNNFHLGLGILFYILGSVIWIASLKYEIFTKAGTVFIVMNMMLFVAVGFLIFKDKLNHWQWTGIILGILSLILINK